MSGALGLLQPESNQVTSRLERPEPSGLWWGRSKVHEVQSLFANWGEGIALPMLESLQALSSGRERAAWNLWGQAWGWQVLQAGAAWGSRRLALQGELTPAPSFSIRVQLFLTSSWQLAYNSCLIPLSFCLIASWELAQITPILRGAHSGSRR